MLIFLSGKTVSNIRGKEKLFRITIGWLNTYYQNPSAVLK
jgi:hypothetical protein